MINIFHVKQKHQLLSGHSFVTRRAQCAVLKKNIIMVVNVDDDVYWWSIGEQH